jgi:transcriptional regulator with XRE-family HTH domain
MFTNLKSALTLRKLHGYQLAGKVGIAPSMLTEVIAGRRPAGPRLRKKIARVLRAPEDWIFQKTTIPAKEANNVDPQICMTVESMADFCSKVEEFSDIASRFLNDEDPAVRERAADAIAKNDKLIEQCRAFIAMHSGPVN